MEACNRRLKQELIAQQHFSNVHDAQAAIGNWVYNYNYQRSHQGIGGLVVPAERFHGQADQVLAAVSKGIDVSANHCYSFCDIERSVINLVLSPDGKLTLYLLGQPILLTGGEHVPETQSRRSRRGD